MVIVLFGLLCPPILQLTRAAKRPHLTVQCIVFGTIAIMLLVPADVLVARMLVAATRQGRDPLIVLQLWLEGIQLWTTLWILLPVALMLSLVWTAKEWAFDCLRAQRDPTAP